LIGRWKATCPTFSNLVKQRQILRIYLIWFELNAIFSYIMATSFSGGGSRSTRREPPTMGKQLVSFITSECESSAPFLAQEALHAWGTYLRPFLKMSCVFWLVTRNASCAIDWVSDSL
jgi:hypothetical protein